MFMSNAYGIIGGVNRKLGAIYGTVGGEHREINKAYAVVGGVNKLVWQSATVFGVMWDYSNSSTALTRLTPSSDPNGYVNISVSSEPTAAIGTSGGSSPFDSYMPWKGMIKYNASAAGAVSAWTSNSNDTVVHIPEFYCKIIDDTSNSKLYIYISSAAISDFIKHPGSGRYVGRYTTGSGYVSKTGLAPLVRITRATARTNSANKGSKWWQYDFATYSAICLLYIVEWADWDCQSKIGQGVTYYGAVIDSGGTDSMTYHTGGASGTDGATAVQYRWIENLWGNVNQWVDGINFRDRVSYVCTNPANFADDTSTNYTAAGVTLLSSNGWIKSMSPGSLGWCLIPVENGGSSSKYVPDYAVSGSGWRVLDVGGYWGNTSYAGLFHFYGSNSSPSTTSSAVANIGARLMLVP